MTFQRRKFAVFCLKKSFCHAISKSHSKFCFLEMKLYPTIVVPNKSEIWWVSETGALFLTVLRGKENIDQGCGGWKHVHIATNKGSWIILEKNSAFGLVISVILEVVKGPIPACPHDFVRNCWRSSTLWMRLIYPILWEFSVWGRPWFN